MTNELPDNLDEIEVPVDEVEPDEVIEEEEEAAPEEVVVDELAELRAQVAKLQNVEGLANDLRRSAGRIQALETRLQQDSSDKVKLNEEISQQFSGVNELLGSVVANIDDTAIDPATKARVLQAYEASKRQAETASLRKQATADALAAVKAQFPELNQESQTQTVDAQLAQKAASLEPRVVGIFDAFGANPDDPEHSELWTNAATMIREGKSEGDILSLFRSALNPSDTADTRRQRTKQRAGSGTPTPAGASDNELKATGDLGKDIESLRALGINV